jgi:hypothetical protein
MPTASELLDMIHRLREEDSANTAALSPEEYLARLEARVAPFRAQIGLEQPKAGQPDKQQSEGSLQVSSRGKLDRH